MGNANQSGNSNVPTVVTEPNNPFAVLASACAQAVVQMHLAENASVVWRSELMLILLIWQLLTSSSMVLKHRCSLVPSGPSGLSRPKLPSRLIWFWVFHLASPVH